MLNQIDCHDRRLDSSSHSFWNESRGCQRFGDGWWNSLDDAAQVDLDYWVNFWWAWRRGHWPGVVKFIDFSQIDTKKRLGFCCCWLVFCRLLRCCCCLLDFLLGISFFLLPLESENKIIIIKFEEFNSNWKDKKKRIWVFFTARNITTAIEIICWFLAFFWIILNEI